MSNGVTIPSSCPNCLAIMQPTAGQLVFTCPNCGTTEQIEASQHAMDKWLHLENRWEPIITMYDEAVPTSYYGNLECDELRYHHGTRTFLLRNDHTIVTIIEVPTASTKNLEAGVKTCLVTMKDPTAAAELCEEANIGVDGFKKIANDIRAEEGLDKTKQSPKHTA